MSLHTRLLGAASALMATSCATTAPTASAVVSGSCEAQSSCRLDGTLVIQDQAGSSPAISLLRPGESCVPLLMSPVMADDARPLDGERITVTGRALPRPAAMPDIFELEYEGRWLHPFVCGESSFVLYVDEVAR